MPEAASCFTPEGVDSPGVSSFTEDVATDFWAHTGLGFTGLDALTAGRVGEVNTVLFNDFLAHSGLESATGVVTDFWIGGVD